MSCTHPRLGVRRPDGSVLVVSRSDYIFRPVLGEKMWLPCNSCIACRLRRSREWALRCMYEASKYPLNCFVTLTYKDEFVPSVDGFHTLCKADFVRFMKRLRADQGPKIRFFQCGEYGEVCRVCGKSRYYCKCQQFVKTLGRPHHHVAFFNFDFIDKIFFQRKKGIALYRSAILERLWPFGYSSISDLTFESAAYIAAYCVKKINGKLAAGHYEGREPEYNTMSRRPGIAHDFVADYYADIYPKDNIHFRGKEFRPPRYFDKVFDEIDSTAYTSILDKRKEFRKSQGPWYGFNSDSVLADHKRYYDALDKTKRRTFEEGFDDAVADLLSS